MEARRRLQPLRERGLRILGCIGSVTANKNQRLLVEALATLDAPDVVAVFVGEGGEALLTQAAAAGLGDRVIACGYQPHASRWLPLMDLLVLPSQTEGQGLAVLEAFRARVPVVASDIPALARIVHHQRTGFLFQAGDAAALATVIRTALSLHAGDHDGIVRAAHARFLEAFTLERMVTRHEELYAQLMASASPADR
jgi:glycosyltransferase involved in cell wall biosynthesis